MTSMKKTLIGLSILSAPVLAASPVYAHAFGQRYDLPIPLSYFMAGAAATVALSFVIIGMFLKGGGAAYRYPRFNLLALPGTALTSRIKSGVARVLSVLLLLLAIATSFVGTDNALENFSPTFVWIIWWVGIGYISALFGNLWMLINPWKALFEWAGVAAGARRRWYARAASIPRRLGRNARAACVPRLRLAGKCVSRLHRTPLFGCAGNRLFALHARRYAPVRQACLAAVRRSVRRAVRHIRSILADGGACGPRRMRRLRTEL